MLQKMKTYIKQNELLKKGDRIAVGVSGGADSICLLHVLFSMRQEYDLQLLAIHINHGIRGEEADRDEQYVKEFCAKYGIECRTFYYDVRRVASVEGLSEEEAGRKVRYAAFLETCLEYRCNKLAIAHNKNDNAETFLFNLFRGSGIRGLSGIDSKRTLSEEKGEVSIIRPLLCVSRDEIEEYLRQEGVDYCTDSTNLTEDYTRNKIRKQILAYAVREINSQSVNNITEAAKALKEIEDYISENVRQRYEFLVYSQEGSLRVPAETLAVEPIVMQKGIIRGILEQLAGGQKDLEAKHVESALGLIQKQVGRKVHLPYQIIVEREYDTICFYRKALLKEKKTSLKRLEPIKVTIPGSTPFPGERKILETKLINYKKYDPIPKSSCMKWFDYDKIENVVEIRTRKEGDYLQINASGGRKKLKDYFIDHKIPQKQRDEQLLIADGSHVMWIPGVGERMSEKYKVDSTTTKILLMKLIDLED